MHAMTILVYFHAWSCFVVANGLKLESDMNFFQKENKSSFIDDKSSPQHEPNEPSNSSFFCISYLFFRK